MALRLLSSPPSSSQSRLSSFVSNSRTASKSSSLIQLAPKSFAFSPQRKRTLTVRSCVKLEEKNVPETGSEWGKVSAVLFDMDGVLCNSEEPSRMAAVDVFAEMGVEVTVEDFVPFMGTGVKGFNPEAAKKRFFEIYLDKYAKPNSGIGFPGALELITQCKSKGLKVAVASSADRIKVNANLSAAGLPLS
ncbi:unnamed protein product, partial [Ilex paraguariensis]